MMRACFLVFAFLVFATMLNWRFRDNVIAVLSLQEQLLQLQELQKQQQRLQELQQQQQALQQSQHHDFLLQPAAPAPQQQQNMQQ